MHKEQAHSRLESRAPLEPRDELGHVQPLIGVVARDDKDYGTRRHFAVMHLVDASRARVGEILDIGGGKILIWPVQACTKSEHLHAILLVSQVPS